MILHTITNRISITIHDNHVSAVNVQSGINVLSVEYSNNDQLDRIMDSLHDGYYLVDDMDDLRTNNNK